MLEKFNFLIVDDDQGAEDGWQRVTAVLYHLNFLNKPIETTSDDNSNSMNYTVFTTSNKQTFRRAIGHLKEFNKDYDFFFFDIDLGNSGDEFLGEDIIEYPRIDIKHLNVGQKSAYVAGLEFINVLEKDDKPKIFFSGSEKVKTFLIVVSFVRNRFDDVMFQDFATGDDFFEKVSRYLNTYILKTQFKTCSNLKYNEINRLLDLVDGNEFDVPCISSFDDDLKQWSLRTLFPRQCNSIEIFSDNTLEHEQREIDELKFEIKNIVTSYPILLSDVLRNGPHIMNDDQKKKLTEEYASKLRILKEKEFRKDDYKGERIKFLPISHFYDESNITDFSALRDSIQKYPWSFSDHLNDGGEKIRMWLCQLGFYPGYLDYILSIERNNAESRGQNIVSIIPRHDSDKLEIRTITRSSKKIETKVLEEVLKRCINTTLDYSFSGQYSEGLQDIIKIVCYRYNGQYHFVIRDGGILFKMTNNKLTHEITEGDQSLADSEVFQAITIKALTTKLP